MLTSTGPREVFTYRTASVLLKGVFPLIAAVGSIFVFYLSNIFKDMGLAGCAVIGAVPSILVAFGAKNLLMYRQEKITIENGKMSWQDWMGRDRGSVYLSQISPDQVTEKSGSTGGTGSDVIVVTVTYSDGAIKFSSVIKDFARLREIVVAPAAKTRVGQALSGVRDIEGDYHSIGNLALSIFVMLFGLVFLCGPYYGWATADPHTTFNGRPASQTPFVGILPFIGAGAVVVLVGIWLLLRYCNERIELSGRGLLWISWRGNEKVRCSLSELKLDTLDCRTGSKGGRFYSVQTSMGKVRWDQSLRNGEVLYTALQAMRNTPSGEPEPTGRFGT